MASHERRQGESIDAMLRKFKRKVKEEGTLSALRDREFHEKPSDKRKKQRKAAARRTFLQQKADEL